MGAWNPGPGASGGADNFIGDGTDESADGLGGNDTLNGNAGNDTLRGNTGVDHMFGGANDDTLVIYDGDEAVSETYDGGAGNDTLSVTGNISVTGAAFTFLSIEALTFFDSGNIVNFLDLNDTAFSAGGFSLNLAVTTYANLFGDVVNITMSTADADFDASGFIIANFDNSTDHINLWGNSGSNTLIGTDVSDWLRGGAGADELHGGLGSDDLRGESIFAADGAIDTLYGGAGNDFYTILEANDLVIELADEGESDAVYATVAYTLTANVENLFMETTALFGTGNGLANYIQGNTSGDTISGLGGNDTLWGQDGNDTLLGGDGNDTMNGGAGADTMQGGDGDDTYIVDGAGDVTTETSALGGADTVQSSVTRTLGANIEDLILTGASAITGYGNDLSNAITGNSAANTLFGFDGNDSLDGGAGADQMFGGLGNDTYYVDNAGDVTSEASALGGIDIIYSSINRQLTANIENLTLTGTAAIGYGNIINNTLVGNASANTLYGFEGNDRLDGGVGADTMFGASGDDTYVVDNVNDITVEGIAGVPGGVDTIESSVDRGLNANIENLTLTGTAAIGYGNVLDNVVTGNAAANSLFGFDGNDTLDGGAGADQMFGGNGNDTYYVDNAGDVTSEASGAGGIDTVISSVGRTLTAFIENLTLTGSANITGSGNVLNNVIIGNAGANTLYGLDGADTLNGGLGADTLQGGAGADTYVFNTTLGGGNVDVIFGYNVADDTFQLDNAVFTGLSVGALAAGAFQIGAAAADADDRIIYNSGTGQLYFDADGVGGAAAILFATLSPGLALTSADFIIGGP